MKNNQRDTHLTPYSKFISEFESSLQTIFEERNRHAEKFIQRGFSDTTLESIMNSNPLSVSVPSEFNGRGMIVKECLGVLEAASYQSLPLSLIFGINIALFLEPLARYGEESVKPDVFGQFINHQAMGGLMISEPLYGSDALNMQTTNFLNESENYSINGIKHWQGLTGMADFWLVASREKTSSGNLGRDISLFLTDESKSDQKIEVEEYYKNNGLYPIPYGKNKLDLTVPSNHKLIPKTTGLKMLMDILHRSRMQFPGMAMGFLKRIMHDANSYCNHRLIKGKSLLQFDQVQLQLTELQNAFTICSAMCHHSSAVSGYDKELALLGMEANSIKAYVTDLMQKSAQTLTQVMGGEGYKIESFGSRGIMDSRPFQIFEGVNEMLYAQISEGVAKEMQKKKISTLWEYLDQNELTHFAADYYKEILNFSIDRSQLQRKHVLVGKIISRVISTSYTLKLSSAGFNKGMIDNAIQGMIVEVSNFVDTFGMKAPLNPIEDFQVNSSWKNIT